MKVKGKTKKLQLNKGLLPIMNNVKKERLKLLEWAWKAWRDAVGKKVRHFFVKLVHLANKGAKDRGYKDYGVFTRSCYDMDPEKFKSKMAATFSKVEPLYKKLHAFVRFKLRYSLRIIKSHRKGRKRVGVIVNGRMLESLVMSYSSSCRQRARAENQSLLRMLIDCSNEQ